MTRFIVVLVSCLLSLPVLAFAQHEGARRDAAGRHRQREREVRDLVRCRR